jgi:SAM-dependent methyltransferase
MEQAREAYWRRYPGTSPTKLRWRALTVRHAFHVLPGESILELGAGSGIWTRELSRALRGENPITATVFNDDLYEQATRDVPANAEFVRVSDLEELPRESFDYVVGTTILCHSLYPENLKAIYELLKPGGQLLFFEANHWNPQVFVKNAISPVGRWAGQPRCQVPMRKYKLLRIASHQGFSHVDIIPYDIVHPRAPRALVSRLQSMAFVLEHMPLVRELCGTLYVWARKPGRRAGPRDVSLATHPELFGTTSIVLPCHNEADNIEQMIDDLVALYDDYIHELVVVDDNSTDGTAEVVKQVASREPRVKLVRRSPPNGVGLALRDGYAAAAGAYILSMDSDFLHIVPELRDLFDAVAEGHDGAFGSRFSHESIMINYPFMKILANRSFHLLANLLLPCRVRDASNNLKLYRAEMLKNLDIRADDFAANAETGLKPILAGYNVAEVPISWINRTIEMGSSSFGIAKVARSYASVLARLIHSRRVGPDTLADGDISTDAAIPPGQP